MIVLNGNEYYPLEVVSVFHRNSSESANVYDRKKRKKDYFYLEVRSFKNE